ncbi:ATP-binding cassette domain-containing protein [Porphyromonas crevioricanis]|uniref:ATP-binding cassette domain-containing protein n=1 Tax=Porphyromonas crevioricanis TaxID=393921 RepID=UPI00069127C9|nr:ATP-binding cassette domain-containing protein [Porphyromonas crevioricanis]
MGSEASLLSPLKYRFVLLFALCFCALVVVLILPSASLLLAMAAVVYSLLLIFKREELSRLKHMTAVAFAFILLGVLPLLFGRTAGDDNAWLSWYGWGVTADTFHMALLVGSRCLAAFGVLQTLMAFFPIYMMASEMRRMGIPSLFVDLFELIYRYIYVLSETAEHIRTAQIARLGYASWKTRLHHSAQLVGQTLVLAYDEADKMYNGLLSRGYDEDASKDKEKRDTRGTSLLPQTDQPILQLKDICYGYDKSKEVLKNFNLSIPAGQRLAILGKNGAGKSTLFLLLNGIFRPSAGSIRLSGLEVSSSVKDLSRLRKEVALVFQNSNYQLFTPSVQDEIAFGLRNIGLTGQALQARVEKQLRDFGLVEMRHTPPHKLSDGQKKWVAIAAVLATDPSVVIFDEPTSNLDCLYSRKVFRLMRQLSHEGKTVILCTHDMDLAYEWAERIVVLRKGEVLGDATPSEIFADTALLHETHLDTPRMLRCSLQSNTIPRPEDLPGSPQCYLPLFIHSGAVRALIVGGGRGAAAKASTLTACGLQTDVIATEVCPDIRRLSEENRISLYLRSFVPGDTQPYRLVVAATGDSRLDHAICREAADHSSLYAMLSDPDRSLFHFAATGQRAGIEIAVHSRYRLPELSAGLRDKVLTSLPISLDDRLEELGLLRAEWIRSKSQDEALARSLRLAYENKVKSFIDSITL